MKLHRLSRAEYLWQPGQIPRRLWRLMTRVGTRPRATIRLPWRFPICVDPHESIGRSIVALNTLDLPVTESLWRLLDNGETCADIGANIGYMTSVMAARLQRGGTIHVFEPVPEIAAVLRANLAGWATLTMARIHFHQVAVSNQRGAAALVLPTDFSENRGQAHLAPGGANGAIAIESVRLDDALGSSVHAGVIKVDVEGFELEVFRGAEDLLRTGRIRDIVFEEHRAFEADSLKFLRSHRYTLFRVIRSLLGPRLASPDSQGRHEIDPPTYLATLDAPRARMRFAPRGWHSLWQVRP